MKAWLKRSLIALGGLVTLGSLGLIAALQLGEQKMQRRIELGSLKGAPLLAARSVADIERGRYLYMSRGCAECHGVNGAGKVVMDDGKGLVIRAPNITPSVGSAVASYSDLDWIRTVRHGVKPSGRPVIIMPSEDYARLTDIDLSAMVTYLRQIPAVAGLSAEVRFPVPMKILFGLGLISDAAAKIDHSLPPGTPVPETVSAQHGSYVANACIGCHGRNLAGGKIAGGPPDWPPASNLTPGAGSAMVKYPDAQSLAAMFRSGKRPDGSEVSSVMPFVSLKEFSDTDIQALYLHLKALQPAAAR
jgi:cytochrome c553